MMKMPTIKMPLTQIASIKFPPLKMPNLDEIFTNKYFLYFVLFLSMATNLGYLMTNNLDAFAFFVAIGLIMVNFSKNMSVVLLVCLLATTFLMAHKSREGREGFKKKGKGKSKKAPVAPVKDEEEDADADEGEEAEEDADEGEEGFEDTDKKEEKKITYKKPDDHTIVTPPLEEETDDNEGALDLDTPESDESAFRPMGSQSANKKSHLDHGASIVKAYEDLNKNLDPKALKSLTKDTSHLMQQQKQLYSSMSSITPLLTQAKSLLKDFDMSEIKGVLAPKK